MGRFIPQGSYSRTCSSIKVKLTCKARKIDGSWVTATYDLTDLGPVEFWNDDGVLVAGLAVEPNGFIPFGSYLQSCKEITVVMSCQAQNSAGVNVPASYDLTHEPEADLWNDDGHIRNAYKTSMIYVAGAFYSGDNADNTVEALKTSGFTSVVNWAFHVSDNGDITNQGALVTGGVYVGHPKWAPRLAHLKDDGSSVNRLFFSIWSGSFPHIKNLIFPNGTSEPQTGPGTVLYESFSALKGAMPCVDGIDFDDEELYDKPTTVAFAKMLGTIGFQVSFCPYWDHHFWVDCLSEIHADMPNVVVGFNLQCYSGGGGQTPAPWAKHIAAKMGSEFNADRFVYPGLAMNRDDWPYPPPAAVTPKVIKDTLSGWNQNSPLPGAFIWKYGEIDPVSEASDYAAAIYGGVTS